MKIVLPESELDAAFNDGKKNIPDDTFNKELSSRNLTAADTVKRCAGISSPRR